MIKDKRNCTQKQKSLNKIQHLDGNIDIQQAKRHLMALDEKENGQFTFQTFFDGPDKSAMSHTITGILHGTLEQHQDELLRRNRLGAGVFVTVNQTDGKGRREENIVSIRAVFADQDDGSRPDLPIEPSFVIQSKRGIHPYWKVDSKMTLHEFRCAQKAIAHNLGSDKKVSDPPRVMRLAGFLHMKDPAKPFLVKIESTSNVKYTVGQIFAAFPKAEVSSLISTDSDHHESKLNIFEKFNEWVLDLPVEEGMTNPMGGRNCTLLFLIREGFGCGLARDDLFEIAHDYCRRSGLNKEIADEMLKRQEVEHQKSPFSSFIVNKKDKYSAAEVADFYLLNRGLVGDQVFKLRYYKDDFYRYIDKCYKKISDPELNADVIQFLQSSEMLKKYATINFTNNVIANLGGKTLVPDARSFSSFLSQENESTGRMIPLENGIFDVDQFMKEKSNPLIEHTPDFFSTNCLSFEYDPDAKCPIWIKFLETMLPEIEIRNFLQEWFGYNLIFDTSHQTFVLFIGEGANGKTVVCVVLRTLLGPENVSAVGLEQFDPKRTFPLAAMIGKLANVVEEIGEIEKAAEGVLKDYVAGGVMTVERKHKDPFETTAHARLTFATNVLPRFKDRSNAVWRRMMPIPFREQILDPTKQDKKLVQSDWWKKSGELPGIFIWAIQGLLRLNEQGHFTEPAVCVDLRREYRQEANPTGTFLKEQCLAKPGITISSHELYQEYSSWMKAQNAYPLGGAQFTREVKKVFPTAKLSTNAKRCHVGLRSRVWVGLGLLDDSSDIESAGDLHER